MVVVALRCGFCEQTFFGRNTSKLTQCSGAYERAHEHEQTCPERPASSAPMQTRKVFRNEIKVKKAHFKQTWYQGKEMPDL